MRHAVLEVDDGVGVDGDAHIAGLEMQVCAGAAACVAAEGDGVAGLDYLVGLDEEAAEVAVDGLHAVGVTHHHIIAITATLILGEANFA